MKSFNEAINIRCANIDTITGQEVAHKDIYTRAINLLGGLDAIIPYIPFEIDEIKKALKEDEHLNNLSMRMWNAASGFHCYQASCDFIGGGIWYLYHKVGINSASCSQGVCLLKEAAIQWVANNTK